MNARLNKKEKQIFEDEVKKGIARSEGLSRIVWNIRTYRNQRRHSQIEQAAFVKRIMNKIDLKRSYQDEQG